MRAIESTPIAPLRAVVAYLRAADTSAGPLPIRLRRVHQPVISPPNVLARPRSPLLGCLCAYTAALPSDHQPAPWLRPSASVVMAALCTAIPLAGFRHAQSLPPSSRVCTAAIPWPSPCYDPTQHAVAMAQLKVLRARPVARVVCKCADRPSPGPATAGISTSDPGNARVVARPAREALHPTFAPTDARII